MRILVWWKSFNRYVNVAESCLAQFFFRGGSLPLRDMARQTYAVADSFDVD